MKKLVPREVNEMLEADQEEMEKAQERINNLSEEEKEKLRNSGATTLKNDGKY